MELSNKQNIEIDFLSKFWKLTPTEQEKKDYINKVVLGEKTDGKNDNNPLFQAKRRLDMNIKSWLEDLALGTLSITELKEDFNHPYMDKVINSLVYTLRNSDKFSRIALTEFLDGHDNGKIAVLNREIKCKICSAPTVV